jgi:hypothetical protein
MPRGEKTASDQISRFGLSADEAVISPNTMLSQCGGVARWPGWKPQNGDCTNVAAYQDCRIRGSRHRQFPDRAVRAGRLAPGPGQRDQAEVRAAARVELQFAISSGKHLWHMKAQDHVSSMSCGNFEDGAGLGLFGESAVATSFVDDDNAITNYPNSEFYYNQAVDQFASTKAASTYYGQAKAKYAKCKDFTESVPASSVPGSGKMETTLMTMSKTKVGKYQAFQLTQAVTLSDSPGFSLDLNTLVTVKGTDVFTVVDLSGTNDAVSTGLMLKFVNRVAKLR